MKHHNRYCYTTVYIIRYYTGKHLCEMKSYEPQFRSKRIIESLKREITATYLPQHWNDALHTSSRWETDAVIKHVTDIEISCEKSKLVSLRNPSKK